MTKLTLTVKLISSLLMAIAFSTPGFSQSASAVPKAGASGYRIVKTIPLHGETEWDYLTLDSATRRLYVTLGTHVAVLNADTAAVIGDIPDTHGVHGVVLAPEFKRGFISNGRSATVTVFDLDTLKTLTTIKTVANPDAIVYDSGSKLIFVMNSKAKSVTAIRAVDSTIAATIPLVDEPEYAVADDAGHVYVVLADPAEIATIDTAKLTVSGRIPLAPCIEPTGIAIDLKNRRLFSSCSNNMMAIVNIDKRIIVGKPAIGSRPDGTAFDPDAGLAFSSNGDGTLTVIHQDAPDKYTVVENVATRRGARTMAFDPKTHNIYLATADFEPVASSKPLPRIKHGSFVILVLAK